MCFSISPNIRNKLKKPLGILLKTDQDNKESILNYVAADSFIITVGDATTEKMLNFNLVPSVQIIDNYEKRACRKPISDMLVNTYLYCNNPKGQITTQSINMITKSFISKTPVRIVVNGEEDLLTIPACIHAPSNSVVLYGQPNKGLVIVKVDRKIRNIAKFILNSMN